MGEAKRRQAMSREEFDKLIVGITQSFADDSKLIALGWLGFQKMCVAADAPAIQRREMCMAFFAGADHLYSSMINMLDPGVEETPDDMRRMEAIHDELEQFRGLFQAATMQTKGEA